MNLSEIENYEPGVMCFACIYFVRDREGKRRVAPSAFYSGECRRYPPACVVEAADDTNATRAKGKSVSRSFPIVSEIDWCGEGVKQST